ncbi:MAG: hypothetical protein IAG13_32805 [Deltaproteobacteria bacterium]|nr:hypothetical protein [Nannocystaceae bacterium]
MPLSLPPLRERQEDIVDIARGRLRELARESRRGPWQLEPCALDYLLGYPWPGNVRELLHAVERATILVASGSIRRDHLAVGVFEAARHPERHSPPVADAVLTFAEAERRHLERALHLTQGKIYGDHGAAALLHLKPTTLQAKLKKHGLR